MLLVIVHPGGIKLLRVVFHVVLPPCRFAQHEVLLVTICILHFIDLLPPLALG